MGTAAWTVQQVEALAPDAGALKAGRELAQPRKWQLLGRSEGAVKQLQFRALENLRARMSESHG